MSNAAPPASPPIPPAVQRRGPSFLLIVLLCLNVALIDLVAAGVSNVMRMGVPMMQRNGPLSPLTLMQLAPAERSRIENILSAHNDRLDVLRLEAKHSRGAVFRLFASPNYDPAKFTKALDAVRAADAAVEEENFKAVADSIATLTPAERSAVVESAKQRNRCWMRRYLGWRC